MFGASPVAVTGWVCPRCQHGVAPTVQRCPCAAAATSAVVVQPTVRDVTPVHVDPARVTFPPVHLQPTVQPHPWVDIYCGPTAVALGTTSLADHITGDVVLQVATN